MKEIIRQSEKAIVYKMGESHFEVWIKIIHTVGKLRGEMIEPKDEDFGVFAWNYYTEKRAMKCFYEIETGKRTITPMVESN